MEAGLGVKVGGGEIRVMRFGRRVGGRRYLSEDLQALRVAGERIREELELLREAGMQRLVAQAELRALQAQIHPHFLFNAFNTLYGIIPKEASGARRTVLNLADIFRYFLETDRTFVSVEDEVRIVRAYLEIEALRLGGKLLTELDVDPAVMGARIPLLSLEPLVENAVKHGVAARTEGGTVRIRVWRDGELLRVAVADTGCGFGEKAVKGGGVGLDNVRQRLRLCYGPEADLVIASSAAGATVSFAVPFPL
jgi:two-component system sensor histidine kinase LytS